MQSRIKNLFKKKEKYISSHDQPNINDVFGLADDGPKVSVPSNLPFASQSDLNRLSALTRRVVISKRIHQGKGRKLVPKTIKEISDPATIKELFSTLEIVEPSIRNYFSIGYILLDFMEENGTVHRIEYLELDNIRWAGTWLNQGNLKNPKAIMQWFEAQGIRDLLDE